MRNFRTLAASLIFLGCAAVSQAATDVKYNDFLQTITFKGDLRIRHEDFFNKTVGQTDRHRDRLRLRLGLDFGLPADLTIKTRFASGTGEQVSTNQSFDNLGSQKNFYIDQVYAEWKAADPLTLLAGKMANPIWRTYSSDIVWDDDFNPEGFAQKVRFGIPGFGGARGFANLMQMVVDEDSGANGKDQWMFAQQVGLDVLVLDQSRLTLAGSLYEWIYEDANDFGQTAINAGNRGTGRTTAAGGTLTNQFRVWELTGEYATSLVGVPLSFQGTYIVNVKSYLTPKENQGVQVGAIIGKASEAKTWEFAYFFKQARTDATIADVADSDFGANGGTNRRGHIIWLGYSPTAYLNFKGKYFMTKPLNNTAGIAQAGTFIDTNRFQLDCSIKF